MKDYINLIGTESIERSARSISDSAEQMRGHFMGFEWQLDQFLRRFTEQIDRLEEALKSEVLPK